MTILLDGSSRVLVQGVTGREGAFHAARMLAAGTKVVGGTSPGKGGQTVGGVPVFDAVATAVAATGADVSVVFVPARFARDALLEAADAGLRVVVCITEGIPVRDVSEAAAHLARRGTLLVGPNGPGVVSVAVHHVDDLLDQPDETAAGSPGPTGAGPAAAGGCNAGIMPAGIFAAGPVGLVSRSGTLTYEIVDRLTSAGFGQTTCVGVGGDPVHGLGFVECLERFEADRRTRVVVLVGEIGGDDEERAAAFAAERMSKPVVAYVAGFSAPPGRRMGHAGAIVSGGAGGAAAKVAALEAAGVAVARRPSEVAPLVAAALAARP
jgi:succinyl-CoA synthetase alpha subunit